MTVHCPLCRGKTRIFETMADKRYFLCENCQSVFLDNGCYLRPDEEKKRYLKHNNDVNAPGYQEFVRPIVDTVIKRFGQQHQGLDFGCGPGPVISKLLQDRGYRIKQYDPFFSNRPDLLLEQYDYIVCNEVIEHFRQPAKEFKLLRALLKPNGALFCQTEIYLPERDFAAWYYKNDPTHIFFYQEQTLKWIRANFGFSSLTINNRLISLSLSP